MNIVNPKELKIIKGLPPVAKKGDKVSIDTEFFGQIKAKLHRPHGTFAYLGCSFDGQTVYYIDDESQIGEFLKRLDAGVWIFHHAKYDITQLRRFTTILVRRLLWDTMLIEQIMWSGYYTDFGLNDLVRRYLDMYMPKDVRSEFVDTVSLTKEQIEYASADVAYTWKVYQIQKEKICEDDLQIWKEIELPFLWTIMSMSGVRLDTKKWLALAKKNEETAKQIQSEYPDINLNSPKQVKEYLLSMGYKVKSTDAEVLTDLAENHVQFATELLAYRNCAKRSSTYGAKFIEDYVETDGKIYADLYQIGAETGRTSCRAPNLQNQPHESDYRNCFIADENEIMVVADWGAQEPKFAAHFSQDQGLIDALNSSEKLYIRIGREALGINITKESPEYKHLKSTVLGLFYGMSAKGLSKRIGVSEDDAQHMIDSILETYPGIKEYMHQQKRAKDYVQSVYGRKIWLNKYSFQWERNALNAPIQSSAADAMKIAAYRFVDACDEEIYQNSPLRLLVHDEIVLGISEGNREWAEKTLERVMIEVAEEMHDGIKGSVEIFHGKSWGCKH